MNIEECTDLQIETFEVFINHILYVRGVYPKQIFKLRQAFNTPVYISIFPPLNEYVHKVLSTARNLRCEGELSRMDIVLFHSDQHIVETYTIDIIEPMLSANHDDEFLLKCEEELRSSLYKLAERVNTLKKLPNDTQFKVLLHTTESSFIRLNHDAHYQEFPWLHETNIESTSKRDSFALLPLLPVNAIGVQINCKVF